jgi:hypothetical protein
VLRRPKKTTTTERTTTRKSYDGLSAVFRTRDEIFADERVRKNEKRVTFRAFVTRRFPVKCTLSLVYLACLRLRLPVHCGDVTLWAADGRLPYLAESARVADAVAAREQTPAEEVTKNKNGVFVNGAGAVDVAARVVAARFAAPLAAALVARSVPKTHLVAAFAARVARVSESGSAF